MLCQSVNSTCFIIKLYSTATWRCLFYLRFCFPPDAVNAASPFFSPSTPLQAASRRKTCHNRVTGCGLCTEGRQTANGHRGSALAKTNYSEPLAVFIALKHFLPFLHHCHILKSSDCSTETLHTAPSAPSRWGQHGLAQSLTRRAVLTLSVTTHCLCLLALGHNCIYRVASSCGVLFTVHWQHGRSTLCCKFSLL